jgi:hypothetical protein
MDAAEREEIVAKLDRAFGGAKDVSPTATHDLHVLFTALDLPPPWKPSPTRALAIFTNWPNQRPVFCVDRTVVGEGGEPPRSNHDAYHLDETWRGFSWTEAPSHGDPVRAIQLWINRFVEEQT